MSVCTCDHKESEHSGKQGPCTLCACGRFTPTNAAEYHNHPLYHAAAWLRHGIGNSTGEDALWADYVMCWCGAARRVPQ